MQEVRSNSEKRKPQHGRGLCRPEAGFRLRRARLPLFKSRQHVLSGWPGEVIFN